LDRSSNLASLKEAIEKRHGKGRVGRASMMRPHDIARLPTGSLALDFSLGGGIPIGRTTMFRGSESSGKSTTLYRIIGIAQGLCANCLRPPVDLEVKESVDAKTGVVSYFATANCDCVSAGIYIPKRAPMETEPEWKSRQSKYKKNSYEEYRVALIDMEASYDPSWGAALGVDNNRLEHVIPDTAEEAIDIYCALLASGSIDLAAVDSLAAMTPSKEIEASAEEWQQGLQARLLNKFVRKSQSASNQVSSEWGRLPTQIWIQQEREKIGIAFGDNTVVPGGKGQLFACSIIVKMWSSKWVKDKRDEGMKKEFQLELGKEVRMNYKIVKNKTFPALGQGGYVMSIRGARRGEILEAPYILAQAEKYGAVRKESDTKWWIGDELFKSKSAMLSRLEEPQMLAIIKSVILEKMLGTEEGSRGGDEDESDS